MSSLRHHYSPFFQSEFFNKHLRVSQPQFQFQLYQSLSIFPKPLRGPGKTPLQAAVLADSSLLLAVEPLNSSRDLSVIVPISGVLLLVYWLANFVVPDMILKDINSKKADEDQVVQKMKTFTGDSISEAGAVDQTSLGAKKRNSKKGSKV